MELPLCDIVTIWTQWAWPILLFILGLGAVVFVHELGHFMVAKAVGIRVDKFALGFGPRLFGIKRGETDYCINLLPLGGYVRMPGQEDFKPLQEGQNDPRAFNNKPIWARMAVTAAGVVMNVLFACLLFVIVGMVGKDFNSPVVGAAEPGYPASQAKITWQDGAPGATAAPSAAVSSAPASSPSIATAGRPDLDENIGLRPGDQIMEISGRGWPWGTFHRPIEHFDQLHIITLVADLDETFTLKFKRHYPLPLPNGSDRIGLATLGVSPIAIIPGVSAPAFGIAPARSLVVAKPEGKVDMPFHPGDVLAEVDGQPINDYWQLEDLEKGFDGREVKLAALRDGKPVEAQLHPLLEMQNVIFRSDGTRVSGALMPYGDKQTTLTAITADGKQTQLPRDKVLLKYREPMDILGMIPRLQVRGIVKGSPADEAGLLPGDIINGYSENGAPTFQQFQDWKYHEDPFFFFWKKKVYEPTTLHILRDNNPLTVSVTPTAINDEAKVGLAIGSDQDHLDVAGIRENSPVFRAFEKDARLERGDMTNAEIIAKFKGYKLDKVNGQDVHNWIAVLNILKDAQRQEIGLVELSLSQGASSKVLKVDLTPAAFSAQDYGFLIDVPFEPLEVKIIKHSPGAAISWGATETRDFMINAYASIRALVKGNISPQAASGPVGLAAASMQFARKGFMSFVYFMAIISTILAVMNFLPIPVVDGGLAVFLIVEKILGKPLPIKVQNIVQLAGLILMVGVFLAVTWHDIARLIKGMW